MKAPKTATKVTQAQQCCGSNDHVQPDVVLVGASSVNRQDPLASLTDEQRAWAVRSEQLWTKAHELARSKPGTDPGDVYHALRCLELPVSERLRRGLARGKLRPESR
ncbi:MAG: hypothetical protein ABSB49_00095 [Polyangia bacterium]|jgi:hypothetical protein